MESDLDKEFKDVFDKISKLKQALAPDIMLKFYAFYKQAYFGNKFSSSNNVNIINGFKFNAWMQLNGMSAEDAKKEYIQLAKQVLTFKK